MVLFQIIAIVFIIFVLAKILIRYKKKDFSLGELLFWLLFWLIAATIVIVPQITSYLADLLGIGRGADLVVYIALVTIFYIIFKIFIRLDKIDREITEIVRKIAVDEKRKKD